jgi:hypothetical protein
VPVGGALTGCPPGTEALTRTVAGETACWAPYAALPSPSPSPTFHPVDPVTASGRLWAVYPFIGYATETSAISQTERRLRRMDIPYGEAIWHATAALWRR